MSDLEFKVKIKGLDMSELDKNDVANYVKIAVESWGGQLHPSHPLFPSNFDGVTVISVKQKQGN